MTHVRGLFQKYTKNRSSKHLKFMNRVKPALWSMSNDMLRAYLSKSKNGSGSNIFEAELTRREKRAAKRKTPRPTKNKA